MLVFKPLFNSCTHTAPGLFPTLHLKKKNLAFLHFSSPSGFLRYKWISEVSLQSLLSLLILHFCPLYYLTMSAFYLFIHCCSICLPMPSALSHFSHCLRYFWHCWHAKGQSQTPSLRIFGSFSYTPSQIYNLCSLQLQMFFPSFYSL